MSREIEDTLLADADTKSPEGEPAAAIAEELADTQTPIPEDDAAFDMTLGAVPSKSTWIPLTLRKAKLSTVSRSTYEIEKELARGGMGRILSARDSRLGRPVAIKELLQGNAPARARFEREAIITARLQHPAIVPLYEAGYWPNGEPFFAMKMVAGEPLDEVARACKNTQERLALLSRVIDVADALAYAHSKEVIHRDLKPANVLVGGFGETVVIDWGLAKSLSDEEDHPKESREHEQVQEKESQGHESGASPAAGDSHALTVLGQAMGTPAYMAPEQARGEKVDKRADVYSLGAILYHVLSGNMAYAGSKSAAEVLSKVLQGPPAPLETVTEGLAAPLLTIVNKAMSRDREDRYQDASFLADELRRYQAGQLVDAHAYSLRALATRWVQGHKTLVASAAVMFVVGTVAALLSYRSIGRERDLAMMAKSRADASAAVASAERKNATHKGLELGLNLAFSMADEDPLKALQEIDRLGNVGEFPDLVARARVIAAHARSQRVTTEFTERGSKHGDFDLSPDDTEVALVWNQTQAALIDLETRAVQILEGTGIEHTKSLRYSPDGHYLVITSARGSGEGGTVLWDRKRGAVACLLSDRGGASDLLFSPDGRWLALGIYHKIKLYDLNAGVDAAKTERALPFNNIANIAFAPDSKTIAVSDQDLNLYDIETATANVILVGEPVPHFPGRRRTYDKLLFSPDGKKLIVATEQVSAIDLETFALTKLFRATKGVTAMAVSSDSVTIAIGSDDRLIYIYDFEADSGRLNTLNGHGKAIDMVAFTKDGEQLLSAGESGEVRLWQLGEPLGRSFYDAHAPEILTERLRMSQKVIFSHDESMVLAYDRFGVLHSWALARPDVTHLGPTLLYARAQFAIGSELLAWTPGGSDSSIFLEKSGEKGRKLGEHGEQIEVLAISADDRYLATGGKTLSLWDVQTGKSTALLGHSTYLRNLSFVGNTLLSTDLEGKSFQWELPSGKGRMVAEHGEIINGMVGVAVDPQGRWIATAGVRGKVLLHDIAKGTKRLISDGTTPVRGLAVSSDGDMLAFSAQPSELTVFFTQSESKRVVLHSPEAREDLYFPDFSPDNRSLVISSDKLGLRLWSDWQSAPTSSRILHSKEESYFPQFSPDGTLIVAPGSKDGVASLWEVATGQRRDLKGSSSNGKAEFWQAGNRIVVSNMHGVVSLWLDDLPHDWQDLSAWIREQISKHQMRSKFQEN